MLTYMHMRWLEVCEYEPPFCPYHHPLFIFNLQQKIAHLFFLLESDHGLCHAWVTQAFLSSCLHYFSSYFVLKGYVWIFFFICSSSQSRFCCSKLEIVLGGPCLHQVSTICFIISQLYNHNLCPCNVDLCSSTLACVLA